MAQSQSFSLGSDIVLNAVYPHGRSQTAFPMGLDSDDGKWRRSETLHQWFKRLVDKHCDGQAAELALEDNIAILALLNWDKQRIIYASVPILIVSGCTLAEYYSGKASSEEIYLRLDLSYDPLGEMFSHPLAHIHFGNHKDPRFALVGGTNGNVLMDFLEFVYRNFAYAKWQKWAKQQWMHKYPAREQEFDLIFQAFKESRLQILRDNASTLSQLKNTLRDAKDYIFNCQTSGADIKIMEYPAAC